MARYLSESDRKVLIDFIREVRGTPTRGHVTEEAPTARRGWGGYLAKVPSGGIPARAGDVPGDAECEIFNLINNTLTAVKGPDNTPLKVTVYNIYETAVPASMTYIRVSQDRYGTYYNDRACV